MLHSLSTPMVIQTLLLAHPWPGYSFCLSKSKTFRVWGPLSNNKNLCRPLHIVTFSTHTLRQSNKFRYVLGSESSFQQLWLLRVFD